jgi:hypothetical protein
MSQIFYSQVNSAVQQELIARGTAGLSSINNNNGRNGRTTKDFDFMLSKVANVKIQAFESAPTKDSKPIAGFGTLGGSTVLNESYRPSGPNGYLNDKIRPARRIPPFITSVSINVSDQSKMYINKASISIKILDATTDLDEMERIYCAPGRYIQMQVAHPDSAILSGATLADAQNSKLPTTNKLQELFPGVEIKNLRKMNEYYFSGRISTFTYSYQEDGSIELTIETIGTTNTYLDVQATMASINKKTAEGEEITNQTTNLYTLLLDDVKSIETKYNTEQNKTEFEHLVANTTDQSILVGIPYKVQNANAPSSLRMISLGYFINFLNSKFMDKVGARIVCSDAVCNSNTFYPKLVSADPTSILLWPGTSDSLTNSYYFDFDSNKTINTSTADANDITIVSAPVKFFPTVTATTAGFIAKDGKAYPSRIYINIELIQSILEKIKNEPTIKKLLELLGTEIQSNTGNAIKMALVQDPVQEDALLYVDTAYIDINANVQEFSVPVFPSFSGRSAVRNFSLTANVPNSIKNMIFGLQAGQSGTQKQVSYNAYIYASTESRIQLEQQWKTDYETSRLGLAKAKNDKASKPEDAEAIKTLRAALELYVTYFTDDIKKSMNSTKVVFPMDLEFTIDGLNGFKFGDVLQFDGLPKRYRDSYVFTVIGITHEIATDGQWTTTLKCNPRVRIK